MAWGEDVPVSSGGCRRPTEWWRSRSTRVAARRVAATTWRLSRLCDEGGCRQRCSSMPAGSRRILGCSAAGRRPAVRDGQPRHRASAAVRDGAVRLRHYRHWQHRRGGRRGLGESAAHRSAYRRCARLLRSGTAYYDDVAVRIVADLGSRWSTLTCWAMRAPHTPRPR